MACAERQSDLTEAARACASPQVTLPPPTQLTLFFAARQPYAFRTREVDG